MEEKRLRISSLAVGYGKPLFSDFNDTVESGNLIGLIGVNGAGKTTLFKTFLGNISPLGGTIEFNNKSLIGLPIKTSSKLISVVKSGGITGVDLQVEEVIRLGRIPHTGVFNKWNSKDDAIFNAVCESMRLADFLSKPMSQLSDGERQRVLIARALVQDTPVLLMDEPTAHLDIKNRLNLLIELRRLAHETNKLIIISTHDLDLALQIVDRVWLINDQKVSVGVPEDLIEKGAFDELFQSKDISFSVQKGGFVYCQEGSKSTFCIKDDSTNPKRLELIKRAMIRKGFVHNENGEINITINKDSIVYKEKTFTTIEDLLKAID